MHIAIENSTWNNIGDAFYQSALEAIFSIAAPHARICSFDGPIARAFPGRGWPTRGQTIDTRKWIDADLYVLSGPILGHSFEDHYAEFLRWVQRNGRSYCLLSVHGTPDATTVSINRRILKEVPPIAFSSRDFSTFEMYGDLVPVSRDGLCAAFHVNQISGLAELSAPPYLVTSMYMHPEPKISLSESSSVAEGLKDIEIFARSWPVWRLTRHFQWLDSISNSELDFCRVIRSNHDLTYKYPHLNYGKLNSYLSYNPRHYLSLYKHAFGIISDRVHACVAALALDTPAVYLGVSERDGIFSRPNAIEREGNVLIGRPDGIKSDLDELLRFIATILSAVTVSSQSEDSTSQ